MSTASRAINRLRRQYRSVLLHMREDNTRFSIHSASAMRSARPCSFEQLEPRLMLSGMHYVVGSRADVVATDGFVTLRKAIEAANTNTAVTADVLAGSEKAYSFGDDASKLGEYAWYDDNAWHKGENYAHPVGKKKPNAWGLYDMHGNVWEWCNDWYQDSYKGLPVNDPKGPNTGKCRVLRGGCWRNNPSGCRSASRIRHAPVTRGYGIGFRVAVDLK